MVGGVWMSAASLAVPGQPPSLPSFVVTYYVTRRGALTAGLVT